MSVFFKFLKLIFNQWILLLLQNVRVNLESEVVELIKPIEANTDEGEGGNTSEADPQRSSIRKKPQKEVIIKATSDDETMVGDNSLLDNSFNLS